MVHGTLLPIFTVLLLVICNVADCAKILVVGTSHSKSHMISAGRIAEVLAKNGHDVTFSSLEVGHSITRFRGTTFNKIVPLGYVTLEEEIAYNEQTTKRTKHVFDHVTLAKTHAGIAHFSKWLIDACERVLAHNSTTLQQLKAERFDALVTEQLSACGYGLTEVLDIPVHFLVSSCALMDTLANAFGAPTPMGYVPASMTLGSASDKMGFLERANNLLESEVVSHSFANTYDDTTKLFQKLVRQNWKTRGHKRPKMVASQPLPKTSTSTFGPMQSVELDEISLGGSLRKAPAVSVSESVHQKGDGGITVRGFICVSILFIINLLNYMDRYTVAGVLSDIQKYYDIDDAMAGFLQTVFIIFYMIFAPLCGFLGDRFNRKWIMTVGLSIWVGAVLASSFIPANHFIVFLLLRGVVGIGEASYAIIAPTIIADMFTKLARSRILMVFYFAIPVGSGLGYVVGSGVSSAFGEWQWGIRVTPFVGILCILAIIFVIEEPERGAAEKVDGADHATEAIKTSYLDDMKYLLSVKTYIWSTIGYTSVVFVTGTLAWWAPTGIQYSTAADKGLADVKDLDSEQKNTISLVFGAITCVGGIVGVTLGVVASQIWREGKFFCARIRSGRADPLICAIGSFVAVPFLFLGLHLIGKSAALSWICIFFSITFLCLNWAINVDMLLYIIMPRRRNIANSWQITLSHLFGDASGPYIIGLVSDWIRGSDTDPKAHFKALLTAFYIPNVLLIVSGVAFLVAGYTVLKDRDEFMYFMGYKKRTAKVGDAAMFNGAGTGLEDSNSNSDKKTRF
uniref:Glucuronosyltransferase n=1 Tax=Panagrellus redivivus TaxID=6233 RepID=A0A7E4UZF3_PANRE